MEEIHHNLDLVRSDRYLPRRKRMWAQYVELAQLPSPSHEDVARVWTEFEGGVWPTPFRDVVWRSLSGSEVMGRMAYGERFILADIYREQMKVDLWHERMFDVWSQLRADRWSPQLIRDNVSVTRGYLADVVAGEERLLRLYEEALERFGGSL